MIIMFGDFYYHAYIKGNGKKAQVKDTHWRTLAIAAKQRTMAAQWGALFMNI